MNDFSGSKMTRSASRPGAIAPLRCGEADQLGRVQGHPAGQVSEREPAAPCGRPDRRERELERGDAAPCPKDVSGVQVLELRRCGRVVRADRVDQALAQAIPEPFAILALPDRRCST